MDVTEWEAEDFLELVWGKRKGWVDLPAKMGGNWIPYYTLWDGNGCGASIGRRISASLRDGEDLYFSVGQFRENRRTDEHFMPSHWLWADLDEVDPTQAAKDGLLPTVAWESSAGRFQGLWRLDRRVGPETHQRLNQALSYKLGADRGGWDLGQVLRLPGTRNFKYNPPPLVTLLWYRPGLKYDPRQVWRKCKRHALPRDAVVLGGQGEPLPWKDLPARAKRMLRVQPDEVVEGERSTRLWELYCLLAEAGRSEDAIYEVASQSAWNKWARRGTGERRMREEIRKAIRYVLGRRRPVDDGEVSDREGAPELDGVPVDDDEAEQGLPFVRYATFMAQALEPPRWMIEGIWTEGAHGIIGGEPKTLKTTLALAMGLSVASGKAFLGSFEARSPGPVLMVQEENSAENVQDVMRKVASSYGLISKDEITISPSPVGSIGSTVASVRFPDDIPFQVLNNHGFNMASEDDREALQRSVQYTRPRMLILDPFEKMVGSADLDRAHEIRPFLLWLMRLRFEYDMAVVLVHHMRKAQASRPGQRMLGSMTFHGWVASALYVSDRGGDDNVWKRIALEREFREQAPQNGLKVDLRMGKPGSLDFDAVVGGWNQADLVYDLVIESGGRLLMSQAMKELELERKALSRRVHGHERLIFEGRGGRSDPRYIVVTDGNGNVPSS